MLQRAGRRLLLGRPARANTLLLFRARPVHGRPLPFQLLSRPSTSVAACASGAVPEPAVRPPQQQTQQTEEVATQLRSPLSAEQAQVRNRIGFLLGRLKGDLKGSPMGLQEEDAKLLRYYCVYLRLGWTVISSSRRFMHSHRLSLHTPTRLLDCVVKWVVLCDLISGSVFHFACLEVVSFASVPNLALQLSN